MGRFALVLLLSIGSACGAEEPTVEQRCEQVRDRLIELRLANATGVDVKAHREAMRTTLGRDFVESCATKLSMAQQRCVLEARDSETAVACAQPR
jgi:hypothetical protein